MAKVLNKTILKDVICKCCSKGEAAGKGIVNTDIKLQWHIFIKIIVKS